MTGPVLEQEAFSSRLRQTRRAQKLTVPAMAKLCKVHKSSLEMYLYGQSMPGALALLNISTGLKVSADWLLTGQDGAA